MKALLLRFVSEQHKTDGESWARPKGKADTLYSDRIQKENSKVQILKMINLKNPGIIDWKSSWT